MFFCNREINNNKRFKFVHIAVIFNRLRRLSAIFLLITLHAVAAFSQETLYGPGYRSMLMDNPALAGSSADGILRISYLNFYPGNNYNLHSFYASYDSYFEKLHGGAGIWISDDYLGGIINDTRAGLSYSYALQAGEELFINAGLSSSFFHRGLNFSGAVLPDMIDPLGGVVFQTGETLVPASRTVFDVGAGFLLMFRNFSGGISVSHLSQPDLSEGTRTERLKRKLQLTASWDIGLNEPGTFRLRPSGFLEIQDKDFSVAAGSSLETKTLAINLLIIKDNLKNLDLQAGFSLNAGRMGLFYSYRLNISSGNGLMPLSLLHQTGLRFSLNTVNKRNVPGTITLPEM